MALRNTSDRRGKMENAFVALGWHLHFENLLRLTSCSPGSHFANLWLEKTLEAMEKGRSQITPEQLANAEATLQRITQEVRAWRMTAG
jgi:hypothetical protein